jgi:hypothetical protein
MIFSEKRCTVFQIMPQGGNCQRGQRSPLLLPLTLKNAETPTQGCPAVGSVGVTVAPAARATL